MRCPSVRPSLTFHIFDFFYETAERNSTNLYRKSEIYQVCVFRADRKNKMAALASGWDIFDFSSESAERNLMKLDRKQDLNVLYQVCVFRADRKNKMAALASDWLRHFRLLLWNRWMEFYETWQEARYQCLLPSLFSGRSEEQDGRPGLWLAESFSTSPLKPLNGIQQNLTGSNISTSSIPSLCFLGWWEKQDGRTGVWLDETFSTSSLKPLNGIQWNLTGSKISVSSTKFVFSGRWVNKNCRPGWSVEKVAHCTQVHDMWPFGPLVLTALSFKTQFSMLTVA